MLYPGLAHVRVKRFTLVSPQRALVTVKGAARSALAPGSILIEEAAPIYLTRAAYAVSTFRIPSGVYRLEGGLFHGHRLPGTVTIEPRHGGYFLRASSDLPLLPGGRYRLTQTVNAPQKESAGSPDSRREPALEIRVCVPGEIPTRHRDVLDGLLKRLAEGFDRGLLFHGLVRIFGWAAFPAGLVSALESSAVSGVPRGDGRPAMKRGGSGEGHRIVVGPRGVRYWVREKTLADFEREIVRRVRGSGGINSRRLAAELDISEDLVEAVGATLVHSGSLEKRGGMLVEGGRAISLPPLERSLEKLLRDAPAERPLLHGRTRQERVLLEKLTRLNIAVRIGEAFCHRERYDAMVQAILSDGHPGDRVTPESARRRVEVPRDCLIDLLSHMEAQGLLRRDGGVRRIAHGMKPIG